MATLAPTIMTYPEWALRHDRNGKVATLVNMMSQSNEILDDMLTTECQSGNAFEFTQVVKIPTIGRRQYNAGVAASLASVAKQTTTCVEYADWVKFDKSLADLNGNVAEVRAQEVGLHMQALGQQVASDLFYASNSTDVTAFNGLASIYSTISSTTSKIAQNVIDGGGRGSDNTSLWLITWGPRQIHTIYPKGTQAGIFHKDYGDLPALDSNSLEFPALRDYISWKIGMAVHDWRFGVRACNISTNALNSSNAANLITLMTQMVYKPPIMPAGVAPVQDSDAMPRLEMGRSAFYCNRTLRTYLDLQAQNKTNVLLRMEEWDGHNVTTFRGIPIRTVDAITDAEAAVS